MKKLPNTFYAWPEWARTTMTREDLKELLLSTSGEILACGRTWQIESKNLGAGVYKVWLSKSI